MSIIYGAYASLEYFPKGLVWKHSLERVLGPDEGSIVLEPFSKSDKTESILQYKPTFIKKLFNEYEADTVVYCGADTVFYKSPFEFIAKPAALISCIPHLIKFPVHPKIAKRITRTGYFNTDFIVFKRSKEVLRFLNWWEKMLFLECKSASSEGAFFDQNYFNHLVVCDYFKPITDPGMNVAWFNLEENRPLDVAEGLKMFQFSGYDPIKPMQLSKYWTAVPEYRSMKLQKLLVEYHNNLMEIGKWQSPK